MRSPRLQLVYCLAMTRVGGDGSLPPKNTWDFNSIVIPKATNQSKLRDLKA